MTLKKTWIAAWSIAVLAVASQARADMIVGAMTLVGTSANINGATSLATVTSLNITSFAGANTVQSGAASGNYSSVPQTSPFSTSTLTLANLAAFSFNSTIYGKFQAVASLGGFTSHIVTQNAGFLDIYLVGNYSGLPVPGSSTTYDSTPTSVEFSFTQSAPGSLVSASGSLNSPPSPLGTVPEPASIALLGLGLVGLGIGRYSLRRRRAAR